MSLELIQSNSKCIRTTNFPPYISDSNHVNMCPLRQIYLTVFVVDNIFIGWAALYLNLPFLRFFPK